jgi:glucosamine-6-phosphate deaminase
MPHYALTMGVGSIMSAKKIILIATGKAKADAVKALVDGEVSPACPASILQFHRDTVIYLDKDAASLL